MYRSDTFSQHSWLPAMTLTITAVPFSTFSTFQRGRVPGQAEGCNCTVWPMGHILSEGTILCPEA